MENMSLNDVYAFYRKDELNDPQAQTMIRFLDLVDDILKSKHLRYGTSCYRLCFCRMDGSEDTDIVVTADGDHVKLRYNEHWDDGRFQRLRSDEIYCRIEDARAALLEVIARLKA
jgi:hypothetical protein